MALNNEMEKYVELENVANVEPWLLGGLNACLGAWVLFRTRGERNGKRLVGLNPSEG